MDTCFAFPDCTGSVGMDLYIVLEESEVYGNRIMSTAERIIKKKSKYKAEMDKLLPKTQSDALWQKATMRLSEYLDRYNTLPKGVHIHTDSRILPTAAIYLTAKDTIGQEKAYKMIEDAAIQGCTDIEKKLANLMKLPGMKSLFVKIWDPMTKRLFGAVRIPHWTLNDAKLICRYIKSISAEEDAQRLLALHEAIQEIMNGTKIDDADTRKRVDNDIHKKEEPLEGGI